MRLAELMGDCASPSPDSVSSRCADLLQLTVWLTPAGTVDEGGVEQPAYLNFDAALLGRPSNNKMEVGSLCHCLQAWSCRMLLSPAATPCPSLAQCPGWVKTNIAGRALAQSAQGSIAIEASATALLARPQAGRLRHTACV